jgi:hypothetical protein
MSESGPGFKFKFKLDLRSRPFRRLPGNRRNNWAVDTEFQSDMPLCENHIDSSSLLMIFGLGHLQVRSDSEGKCGHGDEEGHLKMNGRR